MKYNGIFKQNTVGFNLEFSFFFKLVFASTLKALACSELKNIRFLKILQNRIGLFNVVGGL